MKYNPEISQPWQTIETHYPFITPWFRVRQDKLCTHLGDEILYSYHEHPGSVLIVALTTDHQIILIRHYRYPVRAWCWEIPAGRLVAGGSALEIAQKELLEEVGGVGESWLHLGCFYTSTGSSNEQAQIYLTSNVTIQSSQPEPTELLQVELVPWREAIQVITQDHAIDGPSLLALLLSQPHLAMLVSRT